MCTGGRVLDFEKERAIDGATAYRDTLPKTLELLSSFESHQYETRSQFLSLLQRMIDKNPIERPKARDVHRTMAAFRTSDGYMRCCGTCLK